LIFKNSVYFYKGAAGSFKTSMTVHSYNNGRAPLFNYDIRNLVPNYDNISKITSYSKISDSEQAVHFGEQDLHTLILF